MINFWKLAYETVKKQRDQYKEERDTLIDDIDWQQKKIERLEREIKEFDKDYEMVTNNCIYWEDKAHWLEQRHSKLIDENTRLQNELYTMGLNQDEADDKIKKLERENEKLRKANSSGWKQKDEINNKLISNVKSKDNLLSEISQHIGNKPSSSTYKYFRGKLNALEIREDE